MKERWGSRLAGELGQAWAIMAKDVRVYYCQPPMLMFGLLMPLFIFLSFSVRRELGADMSIAQLLTIVTFFTASSTGPVIIPLERRERTYDRLLTAPISLWTLVLGKIAVGVFFATLVSLVPLAIGVAFLGITLAAIPPIVGSILLATLTFSGLGVCFASFPGQSVGSIMMPSTLLRWPLLFVSGVFVPIDEIAPVWRIVAYVSPLTYTNEIFQQIFAEPAYVCPYGNIPVHQPTVGRTAAIPLVTSIVVLAVVAVVFVLLARWLHHVTRCRGA